jgi:hypothetical protein
MAQVGRVYAFVRSSYSVGTDALHQFKIDTTGDARKTSS